MLKFDDGTCAYTSPHLLMIVDPDTRTGIHASELEQGKRVAVVFTEAEERWNNAAGYKVFSPAACGIKTGR